MELPAPYIRDNRSHPSRVRELKRPARLWCVLRLVSHPSRVRELKRSYFPAIRSSEPSSHPSRVRELKPYATVVTEVNKRSHPSRVRELKLVSSDYAVYYSYVAPLPGA